MSCSLNFSSLNQQSMEENNAFHNLFAGTLQLKIEVGGKISLFFLEAY